MVDHELSWSEVIDHDLDHGQTWVWPWSQLTTMVNHGHQSRDHGQSRTNMVDHGQIKMTMVSQEQTWLTMVKLKWPWSVKNKHMVDHGQQTLIDYYIYGQYIWPWSWGQSEFLDHGQLILAYKITYNYVLPRTNHDWLWWDSTSHSQPQSMDCQWLFTINRWQWLVVT